MTYAVLAESERHVLSITANLDPNGAIFTEDLSNSDFKGLITLRLKQASEYVSAKEVW